MIGPFLRLLGPQRTDYPVRDLMTRARKGRRAIYPFQDEKFRFSLYGAPLTTTPRRLKTLDDLVLLPPQFTPERLEKAIDLVSREPIYHDVATATTIGGFRARFPLVQSSMGSQDDWNRVAPHVARACANLGIPIGIGENVTRTWGYDRRLRTNQPAFLERVLGYLEHAPPGLGGVVIQQNEEDAQDELWNKIYSDPRLDPYLQEGRIAFEIKGGQGAKAGMGGEKIIDRETAKRLKGTYTIHPDPDEVEAPVYERHSAPDIFTEEILERRIKKLKNDYPRVRVWFKTGPYRDLDRVLQIASAAGADNITVDGKEGGTGMSPTIALMDVGLPTLACLRRLRDAKARGLPTSLVVSGRLHHGGHITKALALGADAVAMGRPFLVAAHAYRFAEHFLERELYTRRWLKAFATRLFAPDERSIGFVQNYVESMRVEVQLLTSALGKYDVHRLGVEDLGALDESVARMLGVPYVYAPSDTAAPSGVTPTPPLEEADPYRGVTVVR